MTDAPLTEIERWALKRIDETRYRLGRAPELHELCAQFSVPYNRSTFRAAVRRLQRKGYIAAFQPVPQRLRFTPRMRKCRRAQ
jgi:DNA-binding FadR family transcriptional regulator